MVFERCVTASSVLIEVGYEAEFITVYRAFIGDWYTILARKERLKNASSESWDNLKIIVL